MLPFLPFALEVLPKTGFFPIPSNLLQVGNFNFLWIKFGPKRKQGLRQSSKTMRRQTRKNKSDPPDDLYQGWYLDFFLTWLWQFLGGAWKTQPAIPKRFAFMAQSPHWRCSKTKCNERELNTPKVFENLVRFTFPVFTGGDQPNSWKYFNLISKMGTKSLHDLRERI